MDLEEENNGTQTWNKKVAYFFDHTIGSHNYANGHPMKPLRVAMTDTLIKAY